VKCELVGRPIKRQHQPLAGRVIQVGISDRSLFAYFCEASSVSVWQLCLLHQRYNTRTSIGWQQAVGERGTWLAAAVGARAHCRQPAASIDRPSSADFHDWYQLLIVQWHRT